jgi:IS5 family transposase
MRGQPGFFDLDERYERLSAAGDPLEKLNAIIPWFIFDEPLSKALSDRKVGVRRFRRC